MNPADPYGLIGQVLDGQFRVDRFVGEGGFSVVYRGHHIGLEEPIAVKCLKLPVTLGSALVESFVRRFRDESRLHYRLSQGNLAIVRSIASGTTMSPSTSALVPYMVLEWLEGRSLAEDLEARKEAGLHGRPLGDVIKLLDTAAQALAYAHAQGVVHRDLNPGNLFLAQTRQGPMTKVLDFGVAKVISDHALELGPRAQTIGHIRIFAPAYGAPEQFDDTVGKVGPASDVYSFALIFLEALRDDPVRVGEHIGEFAMTALDASKKPTPRALGIPVGDAVEEVFARAVAMKPEDRPADVGELWGALKNAVRRDAESGRPPHADAAPSRPPTPWKPHAPAAGQRAATSERGVTADMPAPVVELARPGSIAPPPPTVDDARLSRGSFNQTVRMASSPSLPVQPKAASGPPAPLASTLVMDHVRAAALLQTTALPAVPEPSPRAAAYGAPPAIDAGAIVPVHAPLPGPSGYGSPPGPTGYGPSGAGPSGYGPPPGVGPSGYGPPMVAAPPVPARADEPTVVPPAPRSTAPVVALLLFLMLVVASAAGFGVYRVMVARRAGSTATPPSAATTTAPPPTLTSATVPPPPAAASVVPPAAPAAPAPAPEPPAPASPTVAAPRSAAGSGRAPSSVATPAKGPDVTTPVASTPAAVTPGGFDPQAARAALDVVNGVLASCRSRGGKTGDGTVSVTFNPDGKVASAVVDEPPFLGTAEGRCVASRFKAGKMAPFEGAPGTVVYTFHIPK